MCPPDAYSKKRICFFHICFLMLSILFSILFSDQGKECREVSSFFPSMHGGNTGNPGCSRCRGSADESASPALLLQEGSDDSPPRDLTGIFHLVFRRTVSHAVFPGMLPGTLRSRHRSPRSSPGRSTGRRLRSHLLLLFQTVRASHRALPVPSCTVPRQPECESPIARCTGSTK